MFLTRNREGIKNNDLVPNIDNHNYLLENLEITINYLIEFEITITFTLLSQFTL